MFKLGTIVDLLMPNILMLILMTMTLMQGRNGSAKAKNQRYMLSATKQAISIKLATTVGHFYATLTLTLHKCIYIAYPTCFLLCFNATTFDYLLGRVFSMFARY